MQFVHIDLVVDYLVLSIAEDRHDALREFGTYPLRFDGGEMGLSIRENGRADKCWPESIALWDRGCVDASATLSEPGMLLKCC